MRYLGTEDIVFTDINNRKYRLKEFQDINFDQIFMKEIKITEESSLDEIAQRLDIYGREKESLWFKIFDFNAVKIMENNFSLAGIEKLRIPTDDGI